MKKRLILIISLALLSVNQLCAQKKTTTDQIDFVETKDGQLYMHEPGNEGKPVSGELHIFTPDSTQRTEVKLVEGYPEGKLTIYYNNNLYEESNYSDGYMNGISRLFYENGNLMSVSHYTKGVMEGQVKEFTPEGKMISEAFMIKGKLEGIVNRYNDKGEIETVLQYEDGLLDGDMLVKEKIDGNNVITQITYEKGVRNGPFASLYDNNIPMVMGLYKDDKEIGIWEYRLRTGVIFKIEEYIDGELLDEKRLKKKQEILERERREKEERERKEKEEKEKTEKAKAAQTDGISEENKGDKDTNITTSNDTKSPVDGDEVGQKKDDKVKNTKQEKEEKAKAAKLKKQQEKEEKERAKKEAKFKKQQEKEAKAKAQREEKELKKLEKEAKTKADKEKKQQEKDVKAEKK